MMMQSLNNWYGTCVIDLRLYKNRDKKTKRQRKFKEFNYDDAETEQLERHLCYSCSVFLRSSSCFKPSHTVLYRRTPSFGERI